MSDSEEDDELASLRAARAAKMGSAGLTVVRGRRARAMQRGRHHASGQPALVAAPAAAAAVLAAHRPPSPGGDSCQQQTAAGARP